MFDFWGKLNLTSDDMIDLRCQGITVDDENDLAPGNIPGEVTHSVNAYNWKSEGSICLR